MLFQLITTWQVIAATVVVILYFSLVFYVAKLRRSARPPGGPKKKRGKLDAGPVITEVEGEAPQNEGIEEEIIIEE
jgi:hypothetical protein